MKKNEKDVLLDGFKVVQYQLCKLIDSLWNNNVDTAWMTWKEIGVTVETIRRDESEQQEEGQRKGKYGLLYEPEQKKGNP